MGKRGPTPRPTSERRTKCCACRMTPAEYHKMMQGKPAGMSAGAWLRERALSTRIVGAPPAINREQWAQLGRVSGGISALAKAAREGCAVGVERDEIEALVTAVAEIRAALLGGGAN